MTTRLKAYIRRTILAEATERAYPAKRRTKETTESAFRDYAHGTDTGCWNDLIYTVDVLKMFNRYRADCAAAIGDYLSETGVNAGDVVNPRSDEKTTFADMLIACAQRKPVSWEDYNNENSRAQDMAIAGTLAIRFACEYLLSEVASDCGVDL